VGARIKNYGLKIKKLRYKEHKENTKVRRKISTIGGENYEACKPHPGRYSDHPVTPFGRENA
jgi:hypothetical protein